jgi:hypothetical protein
MDYLKDYAPTLMGVLTILVGLWRFSRSQAAEEDGTYLEAIRGDIDKLRIRLDLLEEYIERLEAYINIVTVQMLSAGMNVPPRPHRLPYPTTKDAP